ncbi:hypothetical protein GLOIN_2v1483553 [Rhizophagus clarus]|uniref:Uncharacterized protein n=1 Tax=Rhizophagus clarus TaxID=94130 RepID=A0A8H3LST2_9GLOM|nr:hypothetical protein GLOIN_2v1483553 [Rhizophagus clarus]
MSKHKNIEVTLWTSQSENITEPLIPIRVGQKYVHSLMETVSSNIENSVSEAVSSLYVQIFQNKTRKSGTMIIGYNNQHIIEHLQQDISFFPFFFYLDKIKIFVFGLGTSSKPEFHNAELGYMSSFIHVYKKNRTLFVSKIKDKKCIIEIYQDYQYVKKFKGYSLNEVWNASEHRIPTCKPHNWTNYTLMKTLFKYHLKRRIYSNASRHTISKAKKYARINRYRAPPLQKIQIKKEKFTSETKAQLEDFLLDKSNVSISSHKTYSKTGLPIHYLQDHKIALWQKYSELYPDGIHRTAFMT